MNKTELLQDLSAKNIALWIEKDTLRYRDVKNVLTDVEHTAIQQLEKEVIEELRKGEYITQAYPLSWGQRALWFAHQLMPDSPAYHIPFAVRICSFVNVRALINSFQALINRHACLRTVFSLHDDGEPFQKVYAYKSLCFDQVDASGWNEDELKKTVRKYYHQPFNLKNGPLIRIHLFTRSENEHILLCTIHHIVFDGQSLWMLLTELQKLYAAEISSTDVSLAPLSYSYADYVAWQSEMLASTEGERLFAYWQSQLQGASPILNLPTDRPRSTRKAGNETTHTFFLNNELIQKLRTLSKNDNIVLHTILLAAFQVLLYRYTGQKDILVAFSTSGRPQLKYARIGGFFVNLVVLRTIFSDGLSFKELLPHVRETLNLALEHQAYPFQQLVERLQITRDPHYSPLAQVAFNCYKMSRSSHFEELYLTGQKITKVDFAGMSVESFEITQNEGRFDLLLEFAEGKEQCYFQFKYSTDLFDANTIAGMVLHYQTLLEGVAAHPEQRLSELPILTEVERHQILVKWNNTRTDYPKDKCIHELFEEHVKLRPDTAAVMCNGKQLTYRELNRRANQLAHYLRALGVEREFLVGLCLERSVEMIVGILAVLKAGGAYVPLDPAYPKERLTFMLNDSRVAVLLTQQKFATDFLMDRLNIVCIDTDWEKISTKSEENPFGGAATENLAYVLYTSGSTGKPKGVMLEQRNVVAQLYAYEYVAPTGKYLSGTCVCPYGFDASVLESFSILCFGGTLHILVTENFINAESFANYLIDHHVTSVYIHPALVSGVVSQFEKRLEKSGNIIFPNRILFAVEPIKQSVLQRYRNLSEEIRLINAYGPTEAAVSATQFLFRQSTDPDRRVPIGTPISNYKVYLLDSNLQPVPVGVTGEIFIGGDGLARGYLYRPETTAEKFIPDPFSNEPGARIYKTGDLARHLPDGNIEFLGRIDYQVKIRGIRIELGEIEVVLRKHPQVREVVVVDKKSPSGNMYLAAYVVPRSMQNCDSKELRSYLMEKLPHFMVPSAFIMLETIPMTPNGKVDRQALTSLKNPLIEIDESYAAPRTPVEETLAKIWEDIIGIERVGIYDRFFDVGGNSLAAAQVMSRVNNIFQIELPFRLFFETQTISELSSIIERTKDSGISYADSAVPWISDHRIVPSASDKTDWNRRPPLQRLFKRITRALFYLLARVQNEGQENIPGSGPLIVVGNHINWLDSPLLFSMVSDTFYKISPRPAFIVAERWRKLFHWFFVQVGYPIYIHRGQGDTFALHHALSALKNGGIVGIAPEGTFNRGKLIKAKVGVAYLATQAPAPVLPIVIYGQDQAIHCWKHLHRVPITIRIGKPIHVPSGGANHTALQNYADSVMIAMARMMPPEYRGIYAYLAENDKVE